MWLPRAFRVYSLQYLRMRRHSNFRGSPEHVMATLRVMCILTHVHALVIYLSIYLRVYLHSCLALQASLAFRSGQGWQIDESRDPAYPQNEDIHFKAERFFPGNVSCDCLHLYLHFPAARGSSRLRLSLLSDKGQDEDYWKNAVGASLFVFCV